MPIYNLIIFLTLFYIYFKFDFIQSQDDGECSNNKPMLVDSLPCGCPTGWYTLEFFRGSHAKGYYTYDAMRDTVYLQFGQRWRTPWAFANQQIQTINLTLLSADVFQFLQNQPLPDISIRTNIKFALTTQNNAASQHMPNNPSYLIVRYIDQLGESHRLCVNDSIRNTFEIQRNIDEDNVEDGKNYDIPGNLNFHQTTIVKFDGFQISCSSTASSACGKCGLPTKNILSRHFFIEKIFLKARPFPSLPSDLEVSRSSDIDEGPSYERTASSQESFLGDAFNFTGSYYFASTKLRNCHSRGRASIIQINPSLISSISTLHISALPSRTTIINSDLTLSYLDSFKDICGKEFITTPKYVLTNNPYISSASESFTPLRWLQTTLPPQSVPQIRSLLPELGYTNGKIYRPATTPTHHTYGPQTEYPETIGDDNSPFSRQPQITSGPPRQPFDPFGGNTYGGALPSVPPLTAPSNMLETPNQQIDLGDPGNNAGGNTPANEGEDRLIGGRIDPNSQFINPSNVGGRIPSPQGREIRPLPWFGRSRLPHIGIPGFRPGGRVPGGWFGPSGRFGLQGKFDRGGGHWGHPGRFGHRGGRGGGGHGRKRRSLWAGRSWKQQKEIEGQEYPYYMNPFGTGNPNPFGQSRGALIIHNTSDFYTYLPQTSSLPAIINVSDGIAALASRLGDRIIWPWHVSIKNKGKHICDGFLITDKHILSAAHCFKGVNIQDLTIHTQNYISQNTLNKAQSRNVSKLFSHIYFNKIKKYDNDISLLHVRTPLTINSYTVPICLGTKNPAFDIKCRISSYNNLQGRDDILGVEVNTVTNRICNKPEWLNQRITEEMLCAGGNISEACKGDGGAPLQCLDVDDRRWYAHGIFSWSLDCGMLNKPGVFTNLHLFTKWIRSKINL